MRFVAPVTPSDDPQKMGAAITYFRRYALTSLFLIEGEEDNDLQDKPPAKPTEKTCSECGKPSGNYSKCYSCNNPNAVLTKKV